MPGVHPGVAMEGYQGFDRGANKPTKGAIGGSSRGMRVSRGMRGKGNPKVPRGIRGMSGETGG